MNGVSVLMDFFHLQCSFWIATMGGDWANHSATTNFNSDSHSLFALVPGRQESFNRKENEVRIPRANQHQPHVERLSPDADSSIRDLIDGFLCP
jgi:hypothetical protein